MQTRRSHLVAAAVASAVSCLALVLVAGASAATITVDSEGDAVAADGRCSLREAITAANTNSPVFAGIGECTAGTGPDVVVLPAGRFTLSRAGVPDNTNVNGDLDVLGSEVTIQGAGAASTTIDANRIDRAIDVQSGRVAIVERLTVTGGKAPDGANGGDITGAAGATGTGGSGSPGEPGGGIRNLGTLAVRDATVSDNRAGAAGRGGHGRGGAGATSSSGGDGGFGGGGNAAVALGGDGGGIFTAGGLTLTRVFVTGNVAGRGGDGGLATGGQGGGATTGDGGDGGAGFGGAGGDGGRGGGVAASNGATVTIDGSTLTANRSGDGGANGRGQGGLGGASGGALVVGGRGGLGQAGNLSAGGGGRGGGLFAADPVTVTGSLVSANETGDGGYGGNADGGQGGAITNSGSGGRGGGGDGGDGGDGGLGAGVSATGTFVNVTITGNRTGDGGDGGDGAGAKGGGSVGGAGGQGGNGSGGDGGNSGGGAAFITSGSVQHGTIAANATGIGGAAGQRTAGAGGGGSPPGASGVLFTNSGGISSSVAGVLGGASALTVANTVVVDNGTSNCSSGLNDGGHNVVFPDATCPGTVANADVGGLADNGGPTLTHALPPRSPAVDAVPAGAGCPATDQRGVARSQAGPCDAGAFELAPPAASTGDAALVGEGAILNGAAIPNGFATSYHFDLGVTTNYGMTTPDQSAGAGVNPVAASATVAGLAPNTTYHYRLVASSSAGTAAGEDRAFVTPPTGQLPPGGSSPSAQSPAVDTTRPAVSSASLNPKTFAVNRAGPRETAVAARAKKGTTFRFRLSEAARVLFAIEQPRAGRRVGSRCVKPTRANRSRRKCTRFTVVGRFAVAARSGTNAKKFSGLIGRRALKPGRYRASLTATDAARNSSSPKRLNLRVVRR